jgi:hypothetical protein
MLCDLGLCSRVGGTVMWFDKLYFIASTVSRHMHESIVEGTMPEQGTLPEHVTHCGCTLYVTRICDKAGVAYCRRPGMGIIFAKDW